MNFHQMELLKQLVALNVQLVIVVQVLLQLLSIAQKAGIP